MPVWASMMHLGAVIAAILVAFWSVSACHTVSCSLVKTLQSLVPWSAGTSHGEGSKKGLWLNEGHCCIPLPWPSALPVSSLGHEAPTAALWRPLSSEQKSPQHLGLVSCSLCPFHWGHGSRPVLLSLLCLPVLRVPVGQLHPGLQLLPDLVR